MPRDKSWDCFQDTDFWDVILCSLVEVNQYFGEIYCLHIEGQSKPSKQQARNRWLAECLLIIACLPYSSDLKVKAIHSSEPRIKDYAALHPRRYSTELNMLYRNKDSCVMSIVDGIWIVDGYGLFEVGFCIVQTAWLSVTAHLFIDSLVFMWLSGWVTYDDVLVGG
jgi:hypothetical protein